MQTDIEEDVSELKNYIISEAKEIFKKLEEEILELETEKNRRKEIRLELQTEKEDKEKYDEILNKLK